jgi:hypothetical protein
LASHAVDAALFTFPSHFFMKDDFAAPVSGFPFFPTACVSQLDDADCVAAAGAAALLDAAGADVWA